MTMGKQTIWKRGLSLLLALAMVLSTGIVSAFAEETDAVTINDEALRKAICVELGIPYSEGIAISESQMLALTKLEAPDVGITDLTGLEKARNLETLDVSGNDLSTALTNISAIIYRFQFAKLKSLDMSHCNIADAIYFMNKLSEVSGLERIDLSGNQLKSVFHLMGTAMSWESLKILDLSNNDLNGIDLGARFAFPSLEKIDMTQNRIWLDENAGSWYETVTDVGFTKFDFANQKSLAALSGVYIQNETESYEPSLVDNEKKIIDLGVTLDSTVTMKVQGYGDVQTMSGTLDDADMPIMIAGPDTVATVADNCLFSVNIPVGTSSLTLVLTHASGKTETYTLRVTRREIPDSNEDQAGIKDAVLQRLVCAALNQLDEYQEDPLDYKTDVVTKTDMGKITKLSVSTKESVSDLSGLEYAVNLISLTVRGDFTGSIDVGNWTNLTSLSLVGNYTAVENLDQLSKLKSLTLLGDYTVLSGYENLTKLTTLNVPSQFATAVDVSKLASLKTLSIAVAKDNTVPDLHGRSKLATLTISGDQQNAIWQEALELPELKKIILKDCFGSFALPKIISNQKLAYDILAARDAELTVDISNLNDLEGVTYTRFNTDNTAVTAKKITVKGSADSVKIFTIGNCGASSFDDGFQVKNATSLTMNGIVHELVLPESEAFQDAFASVTGASISAVVLPEGKFPTIFNEMHSLETLTLTDTNLSSFHGMDLSACESLTRLTMSYNISLSDNLDASALPASLEKIDVYGSRMTGFTGDWTKMTYLTEVDFRLNYMTDFPSDAISQMTSLQELLANGNAYASIDEHTFDRLDKLTTLAIGSFLPVVKTGSGWEADPTSATGKAIAALKVISPDVAVSYDNGTNPLGIPSGTYSGLTELKSDKGVLEGKVFSERTLSLMAPSGSDSVTLTPRALLEDTVITVNGTKYHSGDAIIIPLSQMITTVTIDCYNDYSNYLYLDKDTSYTLTITAGEYIENFRAEEGKVYDIAMDLKKADQSTSMASGYFMHNAIVRYADGEYEIRFTTTQADYISDMRYTKNGETKQAEITGGNGVTSREYRIYADSLESMIPVTPQVIPMNSAYTTCYMVFDLTKAIDITASVGADKADLRAAINRAIVITELRNIYTSESYSAMTQALEYAQTIDESNVSTQNAVDAAQAKLAAAIEDLVVDTSKLANKTELKSTLDIATALEKGKHTSTAWNALQEAIANAQAVYDAQEASQSETDAAASSLRIAITLFQNSGDASELDKNKLEDGIYSVYADMIKLDRESQSMADNAINHTVKLEVINGEYYVTLDFQGITIENRFGYLSKLSYYNDGYTYGKYGVPEGSLIPAEILSTQKDFDGKDVIDQYNDANSLYPDMIRMKLVPSAIADENGYVPLHVFVPIMEAIAAGNGDQDVLMKLDWTTLQKTTADDPGFEPQKPTEQSPAVDVTDTATGIKVHADKGVLPEGAKLVVRELLQGAEYDAAALALADVGEKFKLFDISFTDRDGNEIEPNGTVSVSYPIPEGYDRDKACLYRINEDGSKTLIKGMAADGYYTVLTRSFSRYALVETGSTIADSPNSQDVDNAQTGKSVLSMAYLLMILASAGMLTVLVLGKKKKA